MRKIDKILFHAIVPPFIISLSVLTFVVFIHELGSRSELLFMRSASLDVLAGIMTAILPAILIYSLPLSYLIGILIGLTGLSGDSQLTALRACGVPLRKLLKFILLLGVFVGAITSFLSLVILPKTNDQIRQIRNRANMSQATSLIQPRVFVDKKEDFPNIVLYIDDVSEDRQRLFKIFLVDNRLAQSPLTVVASSGSWISDSASHRLQLHLENGKSYSTNPKDATKDNVNTFISTDIPISTRSEAVAPELDPRRRKVVEQSTTDLWRNHAKFSPAEEIKQLIELHRRFALPFSIIPFAFLGLTLAVSSPKGGRTLGFALSLVAVIIFYMLFLNGLRLADVGKVAPWVGAWGADILLTLVGLLLLAKVEQNSTIGQRVSKILWRSGLMSPFRHFRLLKLRKYITRMHDGIYTSNGGFARFRFPKILDRYIFKNFLIFFFWSLIACGTLFVLFTLFDLLDDIIRNRIPVESIVEYFVFLTPQILMITIPMSVLLGILISLGIMEKNSEITAIKAGGWSLYRAAVPIFLVATAFCIIMFLFQDYVLPYANERQDSLHNFIKGRTAQTSRLQRKVSDNSSPPSIWIFGESGRIYNYAYFDGKQDSFVDLNIYEINLNDVKVLRRVHANLAHINPNGQWILENGWIRDYQSQTSGFRWISHETANFPEKAGYFEKEIFQPKESSKKTYSELRKYIKYIMKSGYNATELQIEMYKKVSFPLSCLVMAMLGLPFSFSMGKKGAFFGIGMSIAIAISYWGVAGVFEAMGAYGLLVPLLAAWAPNILFGAAGLVLFLTIRT
jgi:LPS export ABC transporter permease LptG/LPS export ABC transporter permease LptF